MKTTFQIIRIDEDKNQEFLLNQVSKSKRLPFSIICAFEALSGQNVKLQAFTDGEDSEQRILGRGGVLTAEGKAMRDFGGYYPVN